MTRILRSYIKLIVAISYLGIGPYDVHILVTADKTNPTDTEKKFQPCLDSHYPETREDFAYVLNCMELTGEAAEIGVQRAVNAAQFLQKWKGNKLHLIDKWEHVVQKTYVDIANVPTDNMQEIRATASVNLKPFDGRYHIINEWSEEAAKTLPDNSLDFIFLDARHDFDGVFADLRAWWPKLKQGGILAGHDFCDGELPEGDFFVQTAVFAFFSGGLTKDSCELPESPSVSESCGTPNPIGNGIVHSTREKTKYLSFFVLRTAESDEMVKRSSFRSIAAQYVYPRYSWYFALYYRDPVAEKFKDKCQILCEFDCTGRLQTLYPEQFASSQTESSTTIPVVQTSFSIGQPDQGRKSVISTHPSSAFHSYQTECSRRCRVTCEQRVRLFDSILETGDFTSEDVFRVQPEIFQSKVPREREFVLNPQNFFQLDGTNKTTESTTTTKTESTTTSGKGFHVICSAAKHTFKWGIPKYKGRDEL